MSDPPERPAPPGRWFLQRLVVAPGAHALSQPALAEALRGRIAALPGAQPITQLVGFVHAQSGIKQRYFERAPQELEGRRDWVRVVNEATLALAARAVERLVASGLEPGTCDALVVVSATHAGFPGVGQRLQERFGFPVDAPVYELTALGCAGTPQGLSLAQMLLETRPARRVCLVCADAMGTQSLLRRHHRVPSMEQVVAHCLASDGAAAAVLGREPVDGALLSYRSVRFQSRHWPRSLDQNDLTADEENEPYLTVGREIRTRLGDELTSLLDEDTQAAPLFLHPGGAALMRVVKERFPRLAASAELSMSILGDHGNLGAPSVLWLLERALRTGARVEPRFSLMALGPGIFAALLRVDGVERAPGAPER